jgi:hypothetical protein
MDFVPDLQGLQAPDLGLRRPTRCYLPEINKRALDRAKTKILLAVWLGMLCKHTITRSASRALQCMST